MTTTDSQRLEWSAALRDNLASLIDLHGIVQDRIDRLGALRTELSERAAKVAQEQSEEGSALSGLSAASEDAVRRARLVGVKLEASFLEEAIPEGAYRAALAAAFPAGPQSVGATPQQRLEALRRIASALEAHGEADPGGSLAAIAVEGAAAIETANADAKREQEETREAREALEAARQSFDDGYQATKEIVTGLLREAGRLTEARDIFPDR